MSKLTIGSFKRMGFPGSFAHYFQAEVGDVAICLEACLNGYDVAVYDRETKDLLGEKVCTNIEGMELMQIAPGFSMGTGEALEKAIKIANKLLKKHNNET
ncbi:MAG: hypothetical protein NUV80_06055 [Candidatus Berkelbacteria bacterium]|nr:hypothetical protein [Candidatus Berkelbacteria bacterium]